MATVLDTTFFCRDAGWLSALEADGTIRRQARVERRVYDTCVQLFHAPCTAPVRTLFVDTLDEALRIAEEYCAGEEA